MAYAEDLIKLRKRMADAISLGVVDSNSKDLYEATLIQIMNESERQRQICVAKAEELRRQAAIADGQSHAYIHTHSIVYSVLNAHIMAAEKQRAEEQNMAAEIAEKEAAKQLFLANSSAAVNSPIAPAYISADKTVEESIEEDSKRRRKNK